MLSRFFQIRKISDLTRMCVLPVLVLSIFLSFYLCVDMEKIRDKSQELVKNAIPTVMQTQQNAIDLVQLKHKVDLMISAPDIARARQSYSEALNYINELHTSTNQELTRSSSDILFAINHLWKLRLQLNDMRVSINGSLHYMDTVLRLMAHESPELFPEIVLLNSNYIELYQSNTKMRNLLQDHIYYAQQIRKRMNLSPDAVLEDHHGNDAEKGISHEQADATATASADSVLSTGGQLPPLTLLNQGQDKDRAVQGTESTNSTAANNNQAQGQGQNSTAGSTSLGQGNIYQDPDMDFDDAFDYEDYAEALAAYGDDVQWDTRLLDTDELQYDDDMQWLYEGDELYRISKENKPQHYNEAEWSQALAEIERQRLENQERATAAQAQGTPAQRPDLSSVQRDNDARLDQDYANFMAAESADGLPSSSAISYSGSNASTASTAGRAGTQVHEGNVNTEEMLDYKLAHKALPENQELQDAAGTISESDAGRSRALVHMLALYESELKSFEPRWHIFMKLHYVFAYDAHNLLLSLDKISQTYTTGETNLLHEEIGEISYLAWEAMPMVMVTIGFSLVGFWLVIFMLNRYIIVPLKNIARILIKFRHTKSIATQQYEQFAAQEHLIEIREIVDVLPQLFADFSQMSEKSNVLEQRYDELLKNTKYDALTKILNRGCLNQLIKDVGTKTPAHFAVAMIDIDFFKNLNDTMGHQRGDEVLFAVAQTLQGNISKRDMVFRYGGEEFCVILNEITAVNAYKVANRLCKTIRDLKLINEGVPSNIVTISVGLSLVTIAEGQFRVDELINQADKALYLAKRNGRNQVVACPRSMVVAMSGSQNTRTSQKLAQQAAAADEAAAAAEAAAATAAADAAVAAAEIEPEAQDAAASAAENLGKESAAQEQKTSAQDGEGKVDDDDDDNDGGATPSAITDAFAHGSQGHINTLSKDVAIERGYIAPVKAEVGTASVELHSEHEQLKQELSAAALAKADETLSSIVSDPEKDKEETSVKQDAPAPDKVRAVQGNTIDSKGTNANKAERNDKRSSSALQADDEVRAPAGCAVSAQDVAIIHARDKLIEKLSASTAKSFAQAEEKSEEESRESTESQDAQANATQSAALQQDQGQEQEKAESRVSESTDKSSAEPESSTGYRREALNEPEGAEISFTNSHYGEIGLRSGKVVDNLTASPLTVLTSYGPLPEKNKHNVNANGMSSQLKAYAQRQQQLQQGKKKSAVTSDSEIEVVSDEDGGNSIYIPAQQTEGHKHQEHSIYDSDNAPPLMPFDMISQAADVRQKKNKQKKLQRAQEDAQVEAWEMQAAKVAAAHERGIAQRQASGKKNMVFGLGAGTMDAILRSGKKLGLPNRLSFAWNKLISKWHPNGHDTGDKADKRGTDQDSDESSHHNKSKEYDAPLKPSTPAGTAAAASAAAAVPASAAAASASAPASTSKPDNSASNQALKVADFVGDHNAHPVLDESLIKKLIAERSRYDEIDDILGNAHDLRRGMELSTPESLFDISLFFNQGQEHIRNDKGEILGISDQQRQKNIVQKHHADGVNQHEPESWANDITPLFFATGSGRKNIVSSASLPKVTAEKSARESRAEAEIIAFSQAAPMKIEDIEEQLARLQEPVRKTPSKDGGNVSAEAEQAQEAKETKEEKEDKSQETSFLDLNLEQLFQKTNALAHKLYSLGSGRSAEIKLNDEQEQSIEDMERSSDNARDYSFIAKYVQTLSGKSKTSAGVDDMAKDIVSYHNNNNNNSSSASTTSTPPSPQPQHSPQDRMQQR